MISASELRKGIIIELEGKLYEVLDNQHVKMKHTALARVRLRGIESGHSTEMTFPTTEKFVRVELEHRNVQYLYNDGGLYYFMDEENFEQFALNESVVGEAANYLKDGMSIRITSYKDETIGLDLPDTVVLKVVETGPAFRGDTVASTAKPARLETGVTIQVPVFVAEGESVKVDTRSGHYVERAG